MARSPGLARGRRLAILAALPAVLILSPLAAAEKSETSADDAYPIAWDEADLIPEVVVVEAPDQNSVDLLTAAGFDLAEDKEVLDEGGYRLTVVATRSEQERLASLGFPAVETVFSAADESAMRAEFAELSAEVADAEAIETDTVNVLRADWFRSVDNKLYVNIEARTSAGASAATTLQATYGGTTINLSRFVDAGEYQYHRVSNPVPVSEIPSEVTVTSSGGGSATAQFTEWLGKELKPSGPNYRTSFIDKYMDAVETTQRIEELAAQFPDIAEIIELPYETNGYRRPGMATIGGFTNNAVVVNSHAWGHEGGNDITVQFVNPGVASAPLTVSVAGNAITVSLATNASGALSSTAAQVVAAINADSAASALVYTNTYRNNAGGGVVQASAVVQLSDFLNAPGSVPRDAFTVKAIRIGEKRDGSKVGVLAYSQEHAREWVTPLVAVEAASRLLHNYKTDAETKKLVRDLDIFIIPVVNPDGTNYSIHDFTLQRRNMTRYCTTTQNNDPGARNTWGVDLNRNFTVGSRFDGYNGASASCTSDTFSGPSELSEPEAKNEIWLRDSNPNIKFSMNIHSHGGYFMWSPGSYITPGRIPLPRPSQMEEDYFWAASTHILSRIQEHRGTAIWPGRTGPTADVLYSAAGNSADDHYYSKGIYAWNFEVGAPLRNAADTGWVSVGFTPPYAEGYEEAMEFANGLIGMLEVARDFGNDVRPPKTTLVPTDTGFRFESNEPVTIHYTTDGSRPTYESPRINPAAVRAGAESIELPSGTTRVHWFAVDPAGNVEGQYRPTGTANNYRKGVVTVP